jgi:hypothetical protein
MSAGPILVIITISYTRMVGREGTAAKKDHRAPSGDAAEWLDPPTCAYRTVLKDPYTEEGRCFVFSTVSYTD